MKQEICGSCGGLKTKLIPAGTSKKTGRPYSAFYACETCKSEPKKDLESRCSAKFAEIDERIQQLESKIYNIKSAQENIAGEEIDEDLPF